MVTLASLLEYIEVIGTPVILAIVVMYLCWFNKTHTAEHVQIMKRLEDNEKDIDKIADDIGELYKLVLRVNILDDNIPVNIRLDMYDTYKARGHNSFIDKYVEENLLNREPVHTRRLTDKQES